MFKVFLSDEVLFLIDNFIDSYRNKFLKRFIDTWIFNENLIRNNYIEISKEFRNNIMMKSIFFAKNYEMNIFGN